MDNVEERTKKLNELKRMVADIDGKLLSLTKDLNWDYKKFLEETPTNMVTCAINSQHRVPVSKIKTHEEKCAWHQSGYSDCDKIFPEYSGSGSCFIFTPELIDSITKNNSLEENKALRPVPQSSANLDQNFNREEKLALYDHVIANTQKQIVYSDLCLPPMEKKEEKQELTYWEIAAAERDAKRRRASYRNKVHTNKKSHTEILREVIEAQMEVFKEQSVSERVKNNESHKLDSRKSEKHPEGKWKYSNELTSTHRDREEEGRREKNHERYSRYNERSRKRSPSIAGSDSNSRSRSYDKYRKWKSYKGRSHFHKSSKD